MATFKWVEAAVPQGMSVTQVYGFVFNAEMQILLRKDNQKYGLPGGRPEAGEDEFGVTLSRECLEEVQARIGSECYLGYQLVQEEDGSAAYAQVRMIARLVALDPAAPDPDTGRVYDRVFADATDTARLLSWGDVGRDQVRAAVQLAKNRWSPAAGA